jgi:hypothetical protein
MSKKPKKSAIQEVFGKNYIVKNGRKLQIYKCLISEEAGLITMIIIRRLPNGNFALGSYMVDKYCLGLKSTTFKIDLSMNDLEDLLEEFTGMYLRYCPQLGVWRNCLRRRLGFQA